MTGCLGILRVRQRGGHGRPDGEGGGQDDGTAGETTGDSDTAAGTGDGNDDAQDSGKPAYIVDPDTGELVDAVTGEKAEMDYNMDGEGTVPSTEGAETEGGAEDKGST